MKPRRIQRKRTKGWRSPEGAVYVGRPTKWGNPFPVEGSWIMWTAVSLGYKANPAGRRDAAVALHRAWLTDEPVELGPFAGAASGGSLGFSDGTVRTMDEHVRGIASFAARMDGPLTVPPSPLPAIDDLRGKDLVCWCQETAPCHADVLLDLSNAEAGT